MNPPYSALRGAVALAACTFSSLHAEQVVVSEIMYHPPAGLHEYVEVQNLTATVFDIAEWKLRGGVDYDFPEYSDGDPNDSFLKAFERIVICGVDPVAFRAAYGLPAAVRVYGPWTGVLSDGGERVTLRDKNDATRCTVRYNDRYPWPVAPDGGGHSLVLKNTNRAIDDYRVWGVSPNRGGTPGSGEPTAAEEPYANPEVDLSVGLPYIQYDHSWKYEDNGNNLGTAWKEIGYNDNGWSSGPGLFGWEPQVVPAPGINTPFEDPNTPGNSIITYYFRTTFEFNGTLPGTSLSIDLINDDSAGFWLNGQWLGGVGISQGASYTTTSSRTVGDASEEEGIITDSSPNLVIGTNTLAVEVHQTSTGSSDVVFGARVNISAPNAPGVVINEVLPAGAGTGFVEFYNPTGSDIDIGGWFLTDTPGNLTKFQIPGVLNVPSGGLASVGFTESSLSISSPTVVYLTKDDASTIVTGVDTAMPLDGRSVGRKPEGSGSWFLFTAPTRDSSNASASSLGTFLSINEVHFDAQGDIDWIELYNDGTAPVSTIGLSLSSKRDFSDKVALGSSIAGKDHASWDVSFATGGGDELLWLIDASNKVIDAVVVEQATGRAHSAAYPDGSGEFYSSAGGSRNGPNNPDRETDIVITELMIEPPSGHRDGEYVELYNKGASIISLDAWRFDRAIDYSFPAGTSIAPGEYLVVAANPQFTSDAHPAARVLGPYSGNLSNDNELIRLIDQWDNLADEVHFSAGGEWPFLAGGLGSSLELKNPNLDNSSPSAWAASDESNKSSFQTFAIDDRYEQLRSRGSASDYKELHVHAVGDAHIAMRNMSLRVGAGSNLLPNNGESVSTTNSGANGWLCQGTHYQSHMQGNEFHVVSDGHGDIKANRCEIDVTGMNDNDVLRWTCQARWIYGKPTLIVHSWDRSFGGVIRLPIPKNLGTPGAPNSAAAAQPAPTITGIRHSPAVPTSSDPVVVTAKVSSVNPLTTIRVRHRQDNSGWSNPWQNANMFDNGTGGDEVANDGIYSATITQHQSDNRIVHFYVEAISSGGTTISPRNALTAPAMWVVDNSNIPTDLRTQRFVISQRDVDATNGGTSGSSSNNYAFPRLSNHYFNATFIGDESDVIYNAEIRKSGSPWTRSGGADFSRAKWKSPRDQRFRGYTRRSIDNDAGGGRAYHNRIIRYWLYLLGHAANENEFVRVMINGGGASLREDVEPNANDFLKRNWENGEKGELYRIDDQWWFDDGWGRDQANATWQWKGTHEPEMYHAEWIKRSREDEYDYSSFTKWVEKVGTNSFTRAEIERMADIDLMAANAIVRGWVDDWDTLTRNRGKNGYFVRRYSDGKFQLAQWDSDLTFGNSGVEFIGNLTGVRNFFFKPYVKQRCIYYMGEMVDKYTAGSTRLATWFTHEEAASNSYSSNTGTYTSWNNSRVSRGRSDSQVGTNLANDNFNVTTGGGVINTSSDTISIAGSSDYKVFSVRAVGQADTEWNFTNVEDWTLSGIVVEEGSHNITIEALDIDGNVVDTDTITVNKTGNSLPVVVVDSNPDSFNVALHDSLNMDATASFDPEGTNLTFVWSVDNSAGAQLSNPSPNTGLSTFNTPGLYEFSITATDQDGEQQTLLREASVFADSDWSPFTDPLLESFWTEENIEVRHDYSAGAWYSLDDRPGKLTMMVSDNSAKPLTMSNPTHPVLWREIPDSSDFSMQTDVELNSIQTGDFITGLIAEAQEGASSARYVFGMEDGGSLVVQRSTGGSYTQLFSVNFDESDAVIRMRREGDTLYFDRRLEPGSWSNLFTRSLAVGTVMGRGGLFAATGTTQNVRMEFDYFMVVDPSITSDTLDHLRITEIMYNPLPVGDLEWIELINTGGTPLSLDGVSFDDSDPFIALTFGSISLDPGEAAVVVQDTLAFQGQYGGAIRVLAEWSGGVLSNSGEKVVLRDPSGNIIHDFNYFDSQTPDWPDEPDGTGPSLEVLDTEGDYNDPFNWRASQANGGTPGTGLIFDADGDGLSDADEALEGTDPNNPDSDSDGVLDGAEVNAGTDPLNPSSRFEITGLSRNGAGHVTATWSSVPGRTYTLEASADLTPGGWVVVATGIVATGSTTTHVDAAAAGKNRRFYRASVQ